MLFCNKNTVLSLVFLISSIFTLFGQTEDPLITEIHITEGDSLYRHLYIYNDLNQKTLETKYIKIGESWSRREQTEWFYRNGLCTEQHVRKWKNEKWHPFHLVEFGYDSQNKQLLTEIHFNTENTLKTPVTRLDFTYRDGNILEKSSSSYVNDTWRTDSESDFSYNSHSQISEIYSKRYKNNIVSEEEKIIYKYSDLSKTDSILIVKKQNDLWENSTLSIYFYAPNSLFKTSEILKEWNPVYSVWHNAQNIEYKYDALNQLTDEKYQFWSVAFWKNDLAYTYQYDSQGHLLKKTTFLPIYNDFRPAWSINYSKFQYNRANLIEAKNEFWGGEAGSLINTFIPYRFNNELMIGNGSKITINYIPISDTSTSQTSDSERKNSIKIYPNPSKAVFYFNSEIYSVEKWIVTDLNGRVVLSHELIQKSGVVDLGDFKPGVYLFQAFTPDGVKTQKLMKE